MPTAYVFSLRPTVMNGAGGGLGRAAHAAVLGLVGAADPALADRIHADQRVKPLTVSDVQAPTAGAGASGHSLRVTLLTPELEALAGAWSCTSVPELHLDGGSWRVDRLAATRVEHPWAGREGFDELLGGALRRVGSGARHWTLEFASPVTFRQRGHNQPLPTPELVFCSLLDRWNAVASIPLPEELRAFISNSVAVSRYDLRSAPVTTKNGALQIGGVGRCTYTTTSRDHYWIACIDTLTRFAFYGGVGAGTARGFGQARLIEGRSQ